MPDRDTVGQEGIISPCNAHGREYSSEVVNGAEEVSPRHRATVWVEPEGISDAETGASYTGAVDAEETSEKPQVFEQASKFAGGRKGYVFKSGTSGLGYYRDSCAVSQAAEDAPFLADTARDAASNSTEAQECAYEFRVGQYNGQEDSAGAESDGSEDPSLDPCIGLSREGLYV